MNKKSIVLLILAIFNGSGPCLAMDPAPSQAPLTAEAIKAQVFSEPIPAHIYAEVRNKEIRDAYLKWSRLELVGIAVYAGLYLCLEEAWNVWVKICLQPQKKLEYHHQEALKRIKNPKTLAKVSAGCAALAFITVLGIKRLAATDSSTLDTLCRAKMLANRLKEAQSRLAERMTADSERLERERRALEASGFLEGAWRLFLREYRRYRIINMLEQQPELAEQVNRLVSALNEQTPMLN